MESGSILGDMPAQYSKERETKAEFFLFLGPGLALITTITLAYNVVLNPIGIEFPFCFLLLAGLFSAWRWRFKGVFSVTALMLVYTYFFHEVDSFREGLWMIGSMVALFINLMVAALGFEEAESLLSLNAASFHKDKGIIDQVLANVKKTEKHFLEKELFLKASLEEEKKKYEGYQEVLLVKNQLLEKMKKDVLAEEQKRISLEKKYSEKLAQWEEREKILPASVEDLYQENIYYKNKSINLEEKLKKCVEGEIEALHKQEEAFKLKEEVLLKENELKEESLNKVKEELSLWQRKAMDMQGSSEIASSLKEKIDQQVAENSYLRKQLTVYQQNNIEERSQWEGKIQDISKKEEALKVEKTLLAEKIKESEEAFRFHLAKEAGEKEALNQKLMALEEVKKDQETKLHELVERSKLLEEMQQVHYLNKPLVPLSVVKDVDAVEEDKKQKEEIKETVREATKEERRYQGMYLQLKDQFKEKDEVLGAVRKELFFVTQKLWEKEKILEEKNIFGENDFDFIRKEELLRGELYQKEQEVELMEDLVSSLILSKM